MAVLHPHGRRVAWPAVCFGPRSGAVGCERRSYLDAAAPAWYNGGVRGGTSGAVAPGAPRGLWGPVAPEVSCVREVRPDPEEDRPCEERAPQDGGVPDRDPGQRVPAELRGAGGRLAPPRRGQLGADPGAAGGGLGEGAGRGSPALRVPPGGRLREGCDLGRGRPGGSPGPAGRGRAGRGGGDRGVERRVRPT